MPLVSMHCDNIHGVHMEVVLNYSHESGDVSVDGVAEITKGWLGEFHGAELVPGAWMEHERNELNRRLLVSRDDLSGLYARALRACWADYQKTRRDCA